ncbi:right-handed parallel beta-helix repeat-containing protein [Cryobacterium sp. PH31-O1]|uniref:right-handed parallel beta-helix repeat-containing protein n=1 Tax=Cryobacterium sp. PH31-O1 TaxID=3046306 RepID=UPI0024B8E3FB|nr:right-handed parallel beta-helix repeat-containing protein [Cryobacterium sp. PH31-O1]MDJ0338184.1 right-handed parallel beta-helix repeat-containing protein [Cryobacterium sp. PH31-O1]
MAVLAPLTIPGPGGAASAAASRTVIDSSSSKINYTGTWRSTRSAADRGGSVRFQFSAGSASMTFTGSSVAFITRTTKSSGKSTVSIDGTAVATVNGYSATTVHKKTAFSTTSLSSGTHTIKISRTGKKDARSSGTNSIVDAFVVNAATGTAPAPAPAPAPASSPSVHRYADCPAATTTVGTADELMAAVDRAGPGTVIRMTPGTYRGQIDMHANGTAANPIWVCGPRDAVIDVGSVQDNHGIQIKNSSNLVIAGMTVTNSLKGISVISGTNVTIADTRVDHIGYEGIHLRAFTTDSTVVGNTITNTGKRDASYGEGIYIGSSENNWCEQTKCGPDTTDGTRVLGNRISLTGAQPIEVKEGTSDGIIRDNVIDGANAMSNAEEWVKVKGNDWTIDGNQGANSPLHGFAVNGSVAGWGLRNTFTDNSGAVNAGGYAFFIHEKGSKGSSHTDLSCANSVTRATEGFSNLACTR